MVVRLTNHQCFLQHVSKSGGPAYFKIRRHRVNGRLKRHFFYEVFRFYRHRVNGVSDPVTKSAISGIIIGLSSACQKRNLRIGQLMKFL